MAASESDEALIQETEKLFALRERGTRVSALTSELIAMEELGEQRDFIMAKKNLNL